MFYPLYTFLKLLLILAKSDQAYSSFIETTKRYFILYIQMSVISLQHFKRRHAFEIVTLLWGLQKFSACNRLNKSLVTIYVIKR